MYGHGGYNWLPILTGVEGERGPRRVARVGRGRGYGREYDFGENREGVFHAVQGVVELGGLAGLELPIVCVEQR